MLSQKQRKIFKERRRLSIVSNILKRPTDKMSVEFGDMEAIGDPDGPISPGAISTSPLPSKGRI